MNKYQIVSILGCIVLFFIACQNEEATEDLDALLITTLQSAAPTNTISYYRLPDSNDYNSIPQDPRNPLSTAKVSLGQLLFHETAIGIDGAFSITSQTYSCATCHHVNAGFQAGMAQGLGEGGLGFGIRGESRTRNLLCEPELCDVQPIRTPTSMNVAFQPVMLWNGQFGAGDVNQGTGDQWTTGTPKAVNKLGYEGVEVQAIAALDVHRLTINDSIISALGYSHLFDQSFPEFNQDQRYTTETAGLALAAYERTVLSNQAPFQKYLAGNVYAMSEEEKEGALLFFGKAKCYTCHTGPALNKMEFHALGMGEFDPDMVTFYNPEDPAQLGRFSFTQKDGDQYKFKTPQLYNLRDVGFLGHGATFHTIEEVIHYKNQAIPQRSDIPEQYLSPRFTPLGLSDEEVANIGQFINNALFDPNLDRYVPSFTLSGNCFPNNDVVSHIDLKCD
jgi:cytochrome c peroxidase